MEKCMDEYLFLLACKMPCYDKTYANGQLLECDRMLLQAPMLQSSNATDAKMRLMLLNPDNPPMLLECYESCQDTAKILLRSCSNPATISGESQANTARISLEYHWNTIEISLEYQNESLKSQNPMKMPCKSQ